MKNPLISSSSTAPFKVILSNCCEFTRFVPRLFYQGGNSWAPSPPMGSASPQALGTHHRRSQRFVNYNDWPNLHHNLTLCHPFPKRGLQTQLKPGIPELGEGCQTWALNPWGLNTWTQQASHAGAQRCWAPTVCTRDLPPPAQGPFSQCLVTGCHKKYYKKRVFQMKPIVLLCNMYYAGCLANLAAGDTVV